MKKTGFLPLFIAALIMCQVLCVYGRIISAKELAEIIGDENVVVVSMRTEKDYNTVHIENAVHIDHDELCKSGDLKGVLKSPDEVAKILGEKGISPDKTIVVYCNKGVLAGRLYWILDYLGAKDVRVLSGQMKAWRKARKPVTKDMPNITAVEFKANPDPSKIATTEYVKQHINDPKVLIVDVRPEKEYNGEEGETKRKGHLPGAVNFEFLNVMDKTGVVKSKDEILKAVKAAGITSDKEIILYCETSARAGIVYMVLKTMAGYPNVKVYDGGVYEWSADESNPLE